MGKIFAIVVDALNKFALDDGWAIASAIGLALLTSLFPFLIFLAALGGFFGSAALAAEVARLLFSLWPEAVARPISEEVSAVLTIQHGGLLTLSAILALYFSTSAIEALRTGLNRAYDCAESRPWWLLRLQALGLVLIGSLALLALSFLVLLAPLILNAVERRLPGLGDWTLVVTATRLGVASALLVIALVAAHRWLPAKRQRLRDLAPGILATFALSIGFGEGFGFYLQRFAQNYVSTYAGLASAMIALVFLYFAAALFLFGGELNAAILRARRRGP